MRHFDQTTVFAESCLEYRLVKKIIDAAPLIEAVFLEYARYLNNLSLLRGMRYYCEKAFHCCLYTLSLVHFVLSIVSANGKLA